MFPSRAAVLGLLVPLTLLAACQQPSPTPAPAPSFRCTPEAGGDEYDCSQAQHDEMVSKDTLYAEAEAVFRKFFAENIRISRAGGLREATPVLLETATGFFLEDVLNQYRKQADEGSRAQGSDPVIKAISRLPGHSKSGSLIALSTCVDASGWSFFIGKEFRSKGVPARDEIYFSHSDGLLRMIGADGEEVDSCT